MGFFTRLGARLRGRDTHPDAFYGVGLWRQHRDRFNRAVDRFYETALRTHRLHPQAAAAGRLTELTHTLADLAARIDALSRTAHSRCPVEGLVVPAQAQLGELPRTLSRAAAKTAEAAQAAAHTLAALNAGHPGDDAAAAAARFVQHAGELVDRAEAMLGPEEA